MAKKPSYGQLEQRVKELEKEATNAKKAEEALRDSEAKKKAILDASVDRIRLVDKGLRIIWANQTTARSLKVAPEDLVGKHCYRVFRGRRTPCLECPSRKALKSGKIEHTILHRPKKQEVVKGQTYVDSYGVPIKDKSGNVVNLIQINRDMTETKRMEEALRESEQRFRDLVEGSIQGILIHKNFKPLFANRAWADIYGYTVDEILKMDTILPLFAPHEQPRLTQYNKARLRGKDVPIDYEYQAVRKDGSLILVNNRVRLVNWQGERAVQATIFDITEHKRAQEELRESQERFREMAELLPTMISELDRDLNLTYVNQAAFETFGYSQADLEAGLNVMDMIHPDDRKRVRTNIRNVMRGKNLDGNEHRMLTKDGSELTALVHFRPISKNGKVVGARSTVTDITERKRVEQALREREVELEIKSKSLEEVNTALRVLLERRDEDKRELEKKVLVNVKDLVIPYLEKVKKTQLDRPQMACIRVLESNLSDIISPFMRTISAKYLDLTPTEIQVTDLIKEGTRNKDIAKLLNLSVRTVEFHRENIRKKFGLRNRKTNLRTHLLSLH